MSTQKNLKLNNFLIQEFDKNPSFFCNFFQNFYNNNPSKSFSDLDLLFLHAFEKNNLHYLYDLPIQLSNKSFFTYGILRTSITKNNKVIQKTLEHLQIMMNHHIIRPQNILYSLEKLPNQNLYSLAIMNHSFSFIHKLQNFYIQQKPQNPIKFLVKNINPLLFSYDFLSVDNFSYQKIIEDNLLYIEQELNRLKSKSLIDFIKTSHPLVSKLMLEKNLLPQFNFHKNKKI